MGAWEKQLLESSELKPLLYLRFVDDIFGVWLHGEEELRKFHNQANSIHANIKVDLRLSQEQIEFLDVLVNLDGDGNLSTDLFTKPTDSKCYLHFDSDHPSHTKKAVPLGLAMRMKRICTHEDDYRNHRQELKNRLSERGYPENVVEQQLQKVDKVDGTNF